VRQMLDHHISNDGLWDPIKNTQIPTNNEKQKKLEKKTWERDAYLNIPLGSQASLAKFDYSLKFL